MIKEKQNVLVAGANGTTGRIIINILVKSETYQPIAMVRTQDQKDYFEIIAGDNPIEKAVRSV